MHVVQAQVDKSVGQPNAMRDCSDLGATEHASQFREGQERRMVYDVRCPFQYLDDRFGGVVCSKALGLGKPEDGTHVLQDLLRRIPHPRF